ncbi:MAG: hypothetical protein AAGA48_17870 [Myxococcota bacterium]
MIVLLAIACSSAPNPAEGPVRSQPAPPVASFEKQTAEPPKMVFTAITDMFDRGRIGPPKAAATVRPGMPRAEAIEALKTADATKGSLLQRKDDTGRDIDSVLHLTEPPIRFYVLSKADTVVQMQVALPFEAATHALGDLWGDPAPGEATPEGKVTFVWSGDVWKARLQPLPDPDEGPLALQGRGILELTPL